MADSIFAELKRRNVFKVGFAYLVLAWVVIQVTEVAVPALRLPEWVNSLVFFLGAIGFPFALFFAWAFEITPDGVKRESEITPEESITAHTGRKLDFIIIGLLAVGLGYFIYESRFASPSTDEVVAEDTSTVVESPQEVTKEPEGPSIAVLPFVNLSVDKGQEYFSDGISEELLNLLARVPGLKVAGRTSSFSFKGKNADLREIGAALNVGALLEGSVRKSGNTLRITAQLINVVDGFNLWSDTYDRELTDVFAIQDEISAAIVQALKIKLGLDAMIAIAPRRQTVTPQAYEAYLLGQQLLARRRDDEITVAEGHFKRATELAPGFAAAWAYLAITRGFYLYDQQVQEAAQTAFRLAPELPESHMALHAAEQWYYKGLASIRHLDRAIELDPNNVNAHLWRGNSLQAVGRFSAATEAYQRAIDADPLGFIAQSRLGSLLARLGMIDAAELISQRMALIEQAAGINMFVKQEISETKGDYAGAAFAFRKAAGAGALNIAWSTTLFDELGLFDHSNQRLNRGDTRYGFAELYGGSIWTALNSARSLVAERPESVFASTSLGQVAFIAGDFQLAAQAYQKGYACAAPYEPDTYWINCLWYAEAARRSGAIDDSRKAIQILRGVQSALRAEHASEKTFDLYPFEAALFTLEGNIEQALDMLNQAVDAGYLTRGLRRGPVFEELRNHPAYPALKAKTDKLVQEHLDRLAELEQPQDKAPGVIEKIAGKDKS